MAYNGDFALFPGDNMTFPCTECVIVHEFFYLLGIGYVPAGGGGGVPLPPEPLPPPLLKQGPGCVVLRLGCKCSAPALPTHLQRCMEWDALCRPLQSHTLYMADQRCVVLCSAPDVQIECIAEPPHDCTELYPKPQKCLGCVYPNSQECVLHAFHSLLPSLPSGFFPQSLAALSQTR